MWGRPMWGPPVPRFFEIFGRVCPSNRGPTILYFILVMFLLWNQPGNEEACCIVTDWKCVPVPDVKIPQNLDLIYLH